MSFKAGELSNICRHLKVDVPSRQQLEQLVQSITDNGRMTLKLGHPQGTITLKVVNGNIEILVPRVVAMDVVDL